MNLNATKSKSPFIANPRFSGDKLTDDCSARHSPSGRRFSHSLIENRLCVGNINSIIMDRDTIDKRSSLVQSGALRFNQDGTVNRGSSAVRDGSVLVTTSGGVDCRSAAVRQESLRCRPSLEAGASDRRSWRSGEREAAFERMDTIPHANPDLYRQDAVGNTIYRDSMGLSSTMGWHVDHSMF